MEYSVFSSLWWVLLIVSAVLSSVGFYKFVYFLSVGYGFAIAGCGIAIAIMMMVNDVNCVPLYIQCALFVVYGARLSGFLVIREIKSIAYKKTLDSQTSKPIPIFVKVAIWVCVAFLYIMQISPVFYNYSNYVVYLNSTQYVVDVFSDKALNVTAGNVWTWIGVVIMMAGIALEAVADLQKSASKKAHPDMVATSGLYKICRCPNYFGEITFWTGVFISGICRVYGWQWLIAAIGYICIVYIMFNGAQRLEKRQNKNYGDKPEYQAYVSKTPIIIPFVPLYHLVKADKKEDTQA